MNKKYFLNRFKSHNILVMAIFFTLIILMTVLAGNAIAESIEPLDFCIGVDHPPFDEVYAGDGYSYLKLGLTMSLESYDEGAEFTGELSGSGSTVTSGDMLNSDGQLFFVFPLYTYGSYEVIVYDESDNRIFQNDVTVDDSEPECNPESLDVSPPKEETVESTDIVEDVSEPTVESFETEVTETPETTGGNSKVVIEEPDNTVWWPLILVVPGLFLLLIGLLILLKKNCVKERNAWLAATEHAKSLSDKARQAEEDAEKLSEDREQLEEELNDIQSTYPSAGKSGGEEAWIEMDGRRITSRDVAMKREAERAAWDEYRDDPNPESAADLEEDWKASDTPESEEERRELDEEAKTLEKEIKASKEAENEAIKKAKSAKEAEDKAVKKADQARLAYEECMKAALAPANPTPGTTHGTTPGTTDGPPTGGPSIGTGEDESASCNDDDPPQELNRKNLGRVSIPIKLKVTLDGGGAHEAAVAANEISGQLADASEKLGWISKLMDVKGIGETLVRDGVGWSLLGAAAPPAAGQALDMPVPTSPGQLAVDTLSILGKISSVIIGKVPELQARRLPDCDVSATIVSNVFSVECVEIWVCRNGQWVKDRSRFTVKLISKSSGRMTKRRALTWVQAQKVISRYEQIYSGRLSRALDKLANLEAGCQ